MGLSGNDYQLPRQFHCTGAQPVANGKCVVQVGKAEAWIFLVKVAMIAMPQDLVQETEVSFFERKLLLNSYS